MSDVARARQPVARWSEGVSYLILVLWGEKKKKKEKKKKERNHLVYSEKKEKRILQSWKSLVQKNIKIVPLELDDRIVSLSEKMKEIL